MAPDRAAPAPPADALEAALAQHGAPHPTARVDAATVQYVVFSIGERPFALPGARVAEVLPLVPIHFVPGCPPALEGVIDVRGEILSVLRLGDLLGVAHGAPTRHSAILLGCADGMESGLRVDAVQDVLEVVQGSLLDPPELPEPLTGLVTGVFTHRGRPVLVLDLGQLFAAWRAGRA